MIDSDTARIFEGLLDSGSPEFIVQFLRKRSDEERSALETIADAYFSRHGESTPPTLRDISRRQMRKLAYSLLTGSASSIDAGVAWPEEDVDAYMEVLAAQPAAWRAQWVHERFVFARFRQWLALEAILRGACAPPERPQDEEILEQYHRNLIQMHHHVHVFSPERRAELWRANPWISGWPIDLLFEREGDADASLANADQFAPEHQRWRSFLIELTTDGTIERGRLLDLCLDSLTRDFVQRRATWYSQTFCALEPTIEELAARTAEITALLGSGTRGTISFATDRLVELQKAASLDGQAFLAGAAPCLLDRTKKVPLAALGIIEALIGDDPDLAGDTIDLLVLGLSHQNADVQKRSLKLLDAVEDALDTGQRAAIAEAAALVAPTVAPLAAKWCTANESRTEPAPDEADLARRVQDLPPSARALLGLAGTTEELEPAALSEGLLPLLPDAPALERIEGGEEFVLEALAHLQEPHDLARSERVLDAMVRTLPEDLGADLGKTLFDAADRAIDRSESEFYGTGIDARLETSELLLCWFGDESASWPPHTWMRSSSAPTPLLDRRRAEIAEALTSRSPGLASFPTHADGSIRSGDTSNRQARSLGAEDSGWLWARAHEEPWSAEDFEPRSLALYATKVIRKQDGYGYEFECLESDPDVLTQLPLPIARLVPRPLKNRELEGFGSYHGNFSDPLHIREAASAGLRHPEAVAHTFARDLSKNIDFDTALWQNRCLLEPLLRRDVVLGPNGRALLAIGLAAKDAHEVSIATEACLLAIADGRLDAQDFGAALGSLLFGPYGRPLRWAATFGEVSTASPLHARFVQRALNTAFTGPSDQKPHGLSALLERFVEISALTGLPVDDPSTRAYLEALRGSSKAAKAARTLLSTGDPDREAQHGAACRALALEGRLALAALLDPSRLTP